jgi:hypothetical protein
LGGQHHLESLADFAVETRVNHPGVHRRWRRWLQVGTLGRDDIGQLWKLGPSGAGDCGELRMTYDKRPVNASLGVRGRGGFWRHVCGDVKTYPAPPRDGNGDATGSLWVMPLDSQAQDQVESDGLIT